MSIRLFSQWLIFIIMLGLLTACGGGSGNEPSNLLTGTGGNVGGTPPPAPEESVNISLAFGAQRILPSGGSTTVRLTTYEQFDPEDENPPMIIAPNVTFAITIVSGNATLENVPSRSNSKGDATFTVSHPGSGNVEINLSGTGYYEGGFNFSLYFGATVTSELVNKEPVPANGETPANIKVLVRDSFGIPIPSIPVVLSFPLHSFAVPTVVGGYTDISGIFTTGITNTVAQTTKVTPIASGYVAGSLTLTFGAGLVATTVTNLDLIVKSDNVPANGTDIATLVVVARDTQGVPVPNVPVKISSNSATARLNIGNQYKFFFINGNTNSEGNFELNITNSKEETVNITATTTTGDGTDITNSQDIIFADPEAEVPGGDTEAKIQTIELESLNEEALANGTEMIILLGRVIDSNENSVAEVAVRIISGGSANVEIANDGKTDADGIFTATVTDEIAETLSMKAVVGNIVSDLVTISFTAISPEDQTGEGPTSITLLATPEKQILGDADSETKPIILTAIVRDNNNTPMSGISVSVEANSPTANFGNESIKKTDDNGAVTFEVTDTVAGSVVVTVKALSGDNPEAKKTVTFASASGDGGGDDIISTNVTVLDVRILNNNQPANGKDQIEIDVIAKDSNNVTVKDVPIMVQIAAGKDTIATPSQGNTNEDGVFPTKITSTKADEDINVTFAVRGTSIYERRTIRFVAITPDTPDTPATPAKVELQVLPEGGQLRANGESKYTLVVTPRSDDGTPLMNVPVKLISDLTVEEPNGTTNELGEFRTTVKSEIEGTFRVTAVVEGTPISDTKTVTFTPIVGPGDNKISLRVLNDNQPADGESAITLIATLVDANNKPVSNATVKFIAESDNAVVKEDEGQTNARGEFRTTITDTVAESFRVFPVFEAIVGLPKTITFVAPPDEEVDENIVEKVADLSVAVVNNDQPVNSKIEVRVVARDSNGKPVEGVPIAVKLPPGAAYAITGEKETDKDGFFKTEITSSEIGEINVTIGIEGTNFNAAPVKINFVKEGTDPEVEDNRGIVADLSVAVVNNDQPVNSKIEVRVIARDSSDQPVKGVPIVVKLPGAVVAEPSRGDTDDNGLFKTEITSSEPGEIDVTIGIEGTDFNAAPVSVNFITEGSEPPGNVVIDQVADLSVAVINNNQPINGEGVKIVVIARDRNGKALGDVPLVVKMPQGVKAIATPSHGNTIENGTFETTINSSVAGEIEVTINMEGTAFNAAPIKVNFITEDANKERVTDLSVTVVNNNQPVNSEIEIRVTARDSSNRTVEGVPIVVQLPPGAAVANPSRGNTDDNGSITTKITSAKAGVVKVTIAVDGTPISETKEITFTADATAVPAMIRFNVEPQTTLPADGVSQYTLTVIPLDAKVNGTPIPNTEVKLISRLFDETITGTTNELGEFVTTVSSNKVGEFEVTAVAGNISSKQILTFGTVAGINLRVLNDNQPADGKSAITLIVTLVDANNKPVSNAPVTFIDESDHVEIAGGETNARGEFRTTVTNEVAESFKVFPVVNGIVGNPQTITFVTHGVADLSVTVVKNNQPVGTGIDIVVVARDRSGKTVGDVPLVVKLPPGPAVATPSHGKTGTEDGRFNTTISSSESGEFAVTIGIEGTAFDASPVFVNFTTDVDGVSPTTIELIVENSPQPADGKSKITLVVIPRDRRGEKISGVEVVLIPGSDEINIANASGTTTALGEFRTTVTTAEDRTETLTQPLVVNVTPTAKDVTGKSVPVVFTPVPVPLPTNLTLTVSNKNPPANEDVTLTVLARDEKNFPMKDVRVRLRVEPKVGEADITGSVVFGQFEGTTAENTGAFETTLKSSRPGSVIVIATALGRDGSSILDSNSEEITFADDVRDGPAVALIDLRTSSPQLDSEGKEEGVIITATAKKENKNPVVGADIEFSATSGLIVPIDENGEPTQESKTNVLGEAKARLTTRQNHNNRTITVTAKVQSSTGEIIEARINVEVIGTTLTVKGEESVILNSTSSLNIFVKDSADKGLAGETLSVESLLGNSLTLPGAIPNGLAKIDVTTNAGGKAEVVLSASNPGEETITVTKTGEGALSETFSINISNDDFQIEPTNEAPDFTPINIPLETDKTFTVTWKQGGQPLPNQQINLSTTRGTLSKSSLLTNINGEDSFTIRSSNVGPATIIASVPQGPTRRVEVEFVAQKARSMTIQAEPATIGVNAIGGNTEQSEIVVIVRDGIVRNTEGLGNLVKNIRVSFTLDDITGGYLERALDTTDSFGRATTTYFAGSSSSASGGVTVTAKVDRKAEDVDEIFCSGANSVPPLGCSVKLTVALKQVFVSLGTGNKVVPVDDVNYGYPFKVLVTDINQAPIPEVEVVLSIVPIAYYKGYWVPPDPDDEKDTIWTRIETAGPCLSEDVNRNGVLNQGEDANNNQRLEPGAVITFVPSDNSQVEGSTVKVKTGTNGFADFSLYYFKQYATWVTVQLTARALVEGSEDSGVSAFGLPILVNDLRIEDTAPPGHPSPFGASGSCNDTF